MSCLALEGRIFPATTPDRRFVVAYAWADIQWTLASCTNQGMYVV
jgi:hypothetical protein